MTALDEMSPSYFPIEIIKATKVAPLPEFFLIGQWGLPFSSHKVNPIAQWK